MATLEENERSHILCALKKTGGQLAGRGGGAELLAIHPNTLLHRMIKLNIQKSDWGFIHKPSDSPLSWSANGSGFTNL